MNQGHSHSDITQKPHTHKNLGINTHHNSIYQALENDACRKRDNVAWNETRK